MAIEVPVPEGQVSKKVLHFFWLVDYSGSMAGRKIATLNQAIREAIPEVQKALVNHPEVQIRMTPPPGIVILIRASQNTPS